MLCLRRRLLQVGRARPVHLQHGLCLLVLVLPQAEAEHLGAAAAPLDDVQGAVDHVLVKEVPLEVERDDGAPLSSDPMGAETLVPEARAMLRVLRLLVHFPQLLDVGVARREPARRGERGTPELHGEVAPLEISQARRGPRHRLDKGQEAVAEVLRGLSNITIVIIRL